MSLYASTQSNYYHVSIDCSQLRNNELTIPSALREINDYSFWDVKKLQLEPCPLCTLCSPNRRALGTDTSDLSPSGEQRGSRFANHCIIFKGESHEPKHVDTNYLESIPENMCLDQPACLNADFQVPKTLKQEMCENGFENVYNTAALFVDLNLGHYNTNYPMLNQNELIVLRAYTMEDGDLHTSVNEGMKKDDFVIWQTTIHYLNSGLTKASQQQSTPIFKGISHSIDIHEGAIITMKGFNSFSTELSVAERFAKGKTILEATGWRGAPLNFISEFSEEKEILLPPFSRFKVLSITEHHEKHYSHVRLDLIPSS